MQTAINDALRWWIARWLGFAGWFLERFVHLGRIRRHHDTQLSLRRRYQIEDHTPVLPYGPALQASIESFVAANPDAKLALTSGSTAEPKRIAYTAARIRQTKWMYIDCFARAFYALGVRRKSLYVFSALSGDDSLTGLLLAEPKLPPYISGLQAPYRVHPVLGELTERFGATAVRLWVLLLANPGVIYATNPSTLSTFFDAITDDWSNAAALARAHVEAPDSLPEIAHRAAKRIRSAGWQRRLERSMQGHRPPIDTLFEGLEAYICWDGGYVRPFLDRVAIHLADDRYTRIAMYSMSTETIETVTDISDGQVRFVPLGPGVLYEFIAEGADDTPQDILRPEQLEVGSAYAMVVSDAYGLKRYQTDDLFECEAFVDGLPALRFLRRRSLEYSFTGEKLTAEQLAAAYDALRGRFDDLQGEVFLTCVPSQPPSASVPHYKLVVIGDASTEDAVLAAAFDRSLTGINEEYAAKRNSGRLAAPQVVRTSVQTLVKRVGSDRQVDSWESQFKLLPLYRRTWESRDV